jgi:hypothetical protein
MILLEKLKKGILSGFQTASDITSEYTKIGRIKIDLLGLKKEIEEKMLELGGRVYENTRHSKVLTYESEQEINKVVTDISSLEEELKKCEEKLEEIRKLDETSFHNIKK